MSLQLDEYAKDWLAKHAHELPPEELLEETEKQEKYSGVWPTPEQVPNLGIFSEIISQKGFNKIVGDPDNWLKIRERVDLYEKWILPYAIVLFGKTWFDKVKWKKSIHRGITFPLFSDEEKNEAQERKIKLEDTGAGKAIIAKIVSKTSYVLDVYLNGKWLENSTSIKKPGGYIIDSLKNEFIRDIGTDLGYKLSSVLACPYCLANKRKTTLICNGSKQYTCSKCEDLLKSLEYAKIDDLEIQRKIKSVKKFKNFIGITCICPSDSCVGHFVPLNCIDVVVWKITDKNLFKNKIQLLGSFIKDLSIPRNIQTFVKPPEEILDLPLECPFCYTKFTLDSALQSKSGFKNKSGMLTGLPTITIWERKCITSLDQCNEENSDQAKKDSIVGNYFDLENQILAKQKINILIDEIILNMAKINKTPLSGLATWYFLQATIEWMIKYWKDVAQYFFDWTVKERNMTDKEVALYPGKTKKKMTLILRGQETSIHQSLFHTWMHILENHIDEFTKIDPEIKSLKDFGWFCHEPDFCGGPESTFDSIVNSKLKITNEANIKSIKPQKFAPRIAKVFSIYKIQNNVINQNINYVDKIKFYEWQSIKMENNSGLQSGDSVRIKVLLMPGHTTHAPIQRIIRLRTKVLSSIINRINNEELKNNRNMEFWQNRKKLITNARKITGINLCIKE